MRRVGPILIAGVVAFVIAPVIGPTLARLGRPVVKSGLKAGVTVYRSGRVKLAELQETLEDMLADARQQ